MMMMVALSRVYGQQLPTARTLVAGAEVASALSFLSCSSCLHCATRLQPQASCIVWLISMPIVRLIKFNGDSTRILPRTAR